MAFSYYVLCSSVILQIIVCVSTNIVKPPIVQTPNGKIQGILKNEDATYLQFEGIPYAQPPVGKLRFAAPKPMRPWLGTWIANSTYICIQVDHYDEPQNGFTTGVEDCLYLNVYVPGNKINPKGNLEVMVYIHGGGFNFGSPLYQDPKQLMTKDLIFVEMNYRVGIFGFISLGDEYLSGNYGLKDQVLAMKWVRENIRFFGGNPDSVTLNGLSAGGVSAHYHLLSPMSRGLFHRAISASGNVLDPWGLQKNARRKAKEIGRAVGCVYEDDSEEFLKCLRSRPASEIVETHKLFRIWIFLPFAPFGPVVDSNADKPFLPEHPYKMLRDEDVYDVPWLASSVTEEGLYPVAQLTERKEYFPEFEKNFEEYLPPMLHYNLTVSQANMKEVTRKIKKEYLNDQEVSLETFPQIIKMATDRLFKVGMEQSIRMHSKAIESPVYYYLFGYIGEEKYKNREKYGVAHGDDQLMIIGTSTNFTKNDVIIRDLLMDTWMAFIKTGKPSRKDWKPLTSDCLNYLYIKDPETIEMRKSDDLSNTAFWKTLPIMENRKLFKHD